MPLRRVAAASVIVACASVAGVALGQRATPFTLDDYLRTTVGLDASQIAAARRGRVATRLLHTDLSRDVAVFGMVGIHVSRDAYLAHVRDVPTLVAARAQHFGIIGDPIQANDAQAVFFDASERRDLKSCRVNDCNFKLPVSAMEQFAQDVDWEGTDAAAQVDSIMQSNMLSLVAAYRTRGNSAMYQYDDAHGVKASDAFAALLGQSLFLREYAPAFRDYLLNYPSDKPDGAVDVMYWAVDKIPHLRSTFSLNQMLVYTPDSGTALIARKQIYADHYFEASLEVSAVFDAPDLAGGPGVSLVSVQRYRFDSLPGGILNIRGRARSQLQKLMQSDLERERKTVEMVNGN